MSAPQLKQPTGPPVTVPPPPSEDTLVRQVAAILAAGLALNVAAEGIAALLKLPVAPVAAVLRLTRRSSAHRPRTRFAPHGVHGSAEADATARRMLRATADADLYFRAAYVANASRRLAAKLDAGADLRAAVAAEARFAQMHEKARATRAAVAADVGRKAARFGPLLGWYLNPLLHNEVECITADGHNFHAERGTVIGWPGAVHAGCGCTAGPPHLGAGMVNDAIRRSRLVRLAAPTRVYRLRRAG